MCLLLRWGVDARLLEITGQDGHTGPMLLKGAADVLFAMIKLCFSQITSLPIMLQWVRPPPAALRSHTIRESSRELRPRSAALFDALCI